MENNPAEQSTQPVQPVTPAPVHTPPPVESEKPSFLKSKWLKIGLGMLIAIVILGGTFVLGGKIMNKSVVQTPTPVAVATPTPTPVDETANWKTYNSKFGIYTIKYPNNYILSSNIDTYSSLADAEKVSGNHFNIQSNYGTASIREGVPLTEIKLEAFVSGSINKSLDDWIKSEWGEDLIRSESFTVNGKEAKKVWGKSSVGDIPEILQIYFRDSKYSIRFNIWPYNSNYLSVADKILSTFKFTNSTDQTANWKIYTNSQFGLSIQYPNDWSVKNPYDEGPITLQSGIGLIPNVPTQGISGTATPIFIERYENPKNLSLKAWQNEYNQGKPLERRFYSSTDKTTSIVGYTAYTNDKADTCEPYYCHTAVIMAENKIYRVVKVDFDENVYTKEQLVINQEVFDKLLTILKFTQ